MVLVPGDADILVERKGIVEPMAQLISQLLVDLGSGIGIGQLTHKRLIGISPFGFGSTVHSAGSGSPRWLVSC